MAQRLRAKTAKALIDIDLIIPAPIKSALGRPREDCRDALSQDSIRGNHCLAAESSLRGANYATH
jgi:hypothetical protein